MSITAPGWYLFANSSSQLFSNASLQWGISSYTIYQYIYKLSGAPIQPGTQLTNSNWTPIDISNSNNPILDQNTAYWVNIISTSPEQQEREIIFTNPPSETLYASSTVYSSSLDISYHRINFYDVNIDTLNYFESLNDVGGREINLIYKLNGTIQYLYSGTLVTTNPIYTDSSNIVGFTFTTTPNLMSINAPGFTLQPVDAFTTTFINTITDNSTEKWVVSILM